MRLKTFIISSVLALNSITYSFADDARSGINFYSGTFDFSDNKKSSTLFGIEHQNENLYRDTVIGRVSPITGMMITQDAAAYIYTGIEANYDLGPFKFTPSFAPGYYNQEGTAKRYRNIKRETYGKGVGAYIKLLRKWREDGMLDGLDLH